jgi:predicted nucleic acid-binding protein
MNVLFDTNVVLDVLLDRAPFSRAASQLFSKVERGELRGSICATTVTTIFYLTTKALDANRAAGYIQKLLDLFAIAAVNRPVLTAALESGVADFEDAVIDAAAHYADADAIVTRNGKDFDRATRPIYTPDDLLRILAARQR